MSIKKNPKMTPLQAMLVGLVRTSGVPQVVLAERVEVSQKHISEMMNGHVEGSLTMWQSLLDAAGVRL